MKNIPKRFTRRLSLYIMALFLFICCIVITSGFKKSMNIYYNESIDIYNDSTWESLYSNFESAYIIGKNGLLEASKNIQDGITKLDIDKLRYSLTNDLYYSDFDKLLRDNLQTNVFTKNGSMDQNRNSIIVLCNGNIIASYSHTDKYGVPYKEGEVIGSNAKEIINSTFYNVELSLKALEKIENQTEELIVWQDREPENPNAKMYTTFNINTLKEIYQTEGITGLSSYEVLIPVYITKYGNIFGEYDTSHDIGKDNKIILIQKLNLTDYFTKFIVNDELTSNSNLELLNHNYINTQIMINLFEIILYLCIGSYVAFIISNFNRMIDDIASIEEIHDEEDNTN